MPTIVEKLKRNKLLVFIIFVGFAIRMIGINQVPPSLNWDEVSHGYNAYSILETGKDEWGNTMPTIFRAYGDYKLPVYIYTTTISIAIFGLNTFAVRLPSIISGTLLILATYLLTKELFKNRKEKNWTMTYMPLTAALLVAFEPWSYFLSRVAVEANLAQMFIVSGTYFFIRSLRKKSKLLILSSVLLGLSVWTYNSARVFMPLFLVSLVLIYRKELKKLYINTPSTIYYSLFTILVFLIPMFYQLFNPVGQARYGWVSIIDQGAINRIIENRLASDLPHLLNRIIYNRPIYFVSQFLSNYVSHFAPQFLFFEGGEHYQFSVPGQGLLYWINLPFFYLGIVLIFVRSFREKNKIYRIFLVWLLLAPIASSITREAPHPLRAITFLPLPMILSSIGFYISINYLNSKVKLFANKKIYFIFDTVIILIFFFSYQTIYANEYKNDYSWAWQYGYEQIVDYAKENYDQYDKIIVTKKYGEPHEFFLFYWPWPPLEYRNDPNLIRFAQSDWFWVDRFDKFYFVNDWEVVSNVRGVFTLESEATFECITNDCLLITSPGNVPDSWNLLETVYFLDGTSAFEIYRNWE